MGPTDSNSSFSTPSAFFLSLPSHTKDNNSDDDYYYDDNHNNAHCWRPAGTRAGAERGVVLKTVFAA